MIFVLAKALYLRLLMIAFSFFVFSSCKPVIKNLDIYKKQPVEDTEFMPSSELLSSSVPSVIVFEFEDQTEYNSQTSFNKFFAQKTESTLLSNKLAKIVSRDKAGKLQEEIKLAEVNAKGSASNTTSADFAIMGDVTSVSFESQDITQKSLERDQLVSNLVSMATKTEARQVNQNPNYRVYEYKANVVGDIKIYSLPDLTLIDTLTLNGSKTQTEKVKPINQAQAFFYISR